MGDKVNYNTTESENVRHRKHTHKERGNKEERREMKKEEVGEDISNIPRLVAVLSESGWLYFLTAVLLIIIILLIFGGGKGMYL